jgi:hypothetical protein
MPVQARWHGHAAVAPASVGGPAARLRVGALGQHQIARILGMQHESRATRDVHDHDVFSRLRRDDRAVAAAAALRANPDRLFQTSAAESHRRRIVAGLARAGGLRPSRYDEGDWLGGRAGHEGCLRPMRAICGARGAAPPLSF